MAFYENTIVAKQDLAKNELENVKQKYNEIINNFSGKVIKIEDWGLLNLKKKIKNYNKAFFIHYKFEGDETTIREIKKNLKLDTLVLRHLTVKYRKLDVENEYFNKKTM